MDQWSLAFPPKSYHLPSTLNIISLMRRLLTAGIFRLHQGSDGRSIKLFHGTVYPGRFRYSTTMLRQLTLRCKPRMVQPSAFSGMNRAGLSPLALLSNTHSHKQSRLSTVGSDGCYRKVPKPQAVVPDMPCFMLTPQNILQIMKDV
jgi:hypothetical protein